VANGIEIKFPNPLTYSGNLAATFSSSVTSGHNEIRFGQAYKKEDECQGCTAGHVRAVERNTMKRANKYALS